MSRRIDKGIRWFKFVLLVVGTGAGIKAFFALGHPSTGNKLAEALLQFIGGTIIFGGPAFLLGWLDGKEGTLKTSNPPLAPTKSSIESISPLPNRGELPVNTPSLQLPASQNPLEPSAIEEALYAQALTELEGANRKDGLWAKAFAEAQGNESVAKASYLKWRVEQLTREQGARNRESQRRQQEEARQKELERVREEERKNALLPKGICPNCRAEIPLASEACPKCHAIFSGTTTWRVIPRTEA